MEQRWKSDEEVREIVEGVYKNGLKNKGSNQMAKMKMNVVLHEIYPMKSAGFEGVSAIVHVGCIYPDIKYTKGKTYESKSPRLDTHVVNIGFKSLAEAKIVYKAFLMMQENAIVYEEDNIIDPIVFDNYQIGV